MNGNGSERMAEIIGGVAMSHSPLIMTSEKKGGEKGQRFIQKAKEMKTWLEEIGADVLVLISGDHFNHHFYNHMPTFTIGIDECEGLGDWLLPEYKIPVQKDLAKHILSEGLKHNFDFSFTLSMKVDHGHTQGIYFLDPDLSIPVVPISVNTVAPPLPTMDRCFQLGECIRRAVQTWNSDKKIAIAASGGLSHWVPVPKVDSQKPEDQEMIHLMKNGLRVITVSKEEFYKGRIERVTKIESGPVNEKGDREFLELITKGEIATLRDWSYEEIEENFGNGGQEIRNWMVLLGAIQNLEADVVCYEPIPEWVTGMGIVQFKQPVNINPPNKASQSQIRSGR
jgi:2,3-dihydroxyphenylpropionate 1,2-dioxygenase